MYICYLKIKLPLCQLPLLKLLDTGGGNFSFLQFSENTAYILPSYLLHTADTSVYICLLGTADFLVLSSAPKQNAVEPGDAVYMAFVMFSNLKMNPEGMHEDNFHCMVCKSPHPLHQNLSASLDLGMAPLVGEDHE